jgi:quinol monooxygenase YgiN
MIIRIVKMDLIEAEVDSFVADFNEFSHNIRKMEGCNHLELWQDIENKGICFTYSIWEDEQYLDKYKETELFGRVWSRAKSIFKGKPEAWSVNQVKVLK